MLDEREINGCEVTSGENRHGGKLSKWRFTARVRGIVGVDGEAARV